MNIVITGILLMQMDSLDLPLLVSSEILLIASQVSEPLAKNERLF